MRRGHASDEQSSGITLIELMVALALGSFLMIGAITVFTKSRATFRVAESVSRLQENARYLFDVIEPDIRMAGYFGLAAGPQAIQGRFAPTDPVSPLAAARDCGPNWSIDVDRPVEGTDGGYELGCRAFDVPVPAADTLTIRRVSSEPVAVPEPGRLYLQSARDLTSTLFIGPTVPPAFATPDSRTHAMIVNGYYVSQGSVMSTANNPSPSLRRKYLRGGSGGPAITDEEVLPGVEDLQVQFGLATGESGPVGRDVSRYVQPDDPILDRASASYDSTAAILAVRVWLRLRSESREPGLPPDTGFRYADQVVGPFNDGYRRLVVTKTIYLRNARSAS